jgi:chemotaxis protein MotA
VAIIVVVSGTVGAIFISYPYEDIKAAFHVASNSYMASPPTTQHIVDAMLDLSVRSRQDGLLSLEKMEEQTTVAFLKNALAMMVDGYKLNELRDILETEMYFFKLRRMRSERVFRHMSKLAPAFGISGSVIGLIGMLSGLGDTTVILSTIPIALTSTLYGIVLSNFFLTPVAENIHIKTQKELLMQRLVLDGVTAIATESNTFKLGKKLESFLTPADRSVAPASFVELRERYKHLRKLEEQEA